MIPFCPPCNLHGADTRRRAGGSSSGRGGSEFQKQGKADEELDADLALQQEVRIVARAVSHAVADARAGRLVAPDGDLKDPRPK